MSFFEVCFLEGSLPLSLLFLLVLGRMRMPKQSCSSSNEAILCLIVNRNCLLGKRSYRVATHFVPRHQRGRLALLSASSVLVAAVLFVLAGRLEGAHFVVVVALGANTNFVGVVHEAATVADGQFVAALFVTWLLEASLLGAYFPAVASPRESGKVSAEVAL